MRIDHIVLTVGSLEDTCSFYERALKARRVDAPGRPTALLMGESKINVHEVGHTFEPKAVNPTPGSADFCVITEEPIDAVEEHLARQGVVVEAGPIERNGALGPMRSLYFRDPDGNLVEVSRYS